MAIPVQTQNFVASGGDMESQGVLSLAESFSSADSKNVHIDKLGRIKKVLGYTIQNSTSVTTDTGGDDTLCHALWIDEASGHLVGIFHDGVAYGGAVSIDEYEVWRSNTGDGATWTFLRELTSSSFYDLPDAANFRGELFIATPRQTAQVYNGTTLADAGGTQGNTATASEGAVGHPDGTYEFKVIPMTGNSRGLASAVSTAIQVAEHAITLSWTSHGGSTTGVEVYATTGTGLEFYFAGYADGNTVTAFTYDLTDIELLFNRPLDEHGEAPPAGAFLVEEHKNRLWWARVDDGANRIYWSSPNDGDSVGVNSFFLIQSVHRGSTNITALLGNYKDSLFSFTEWGITRISGSGQILAGDGIPDWRLTPTSSSTGTASHESVVRVPAGARYLNRDGEVVETSEVLIAYLAGDNTIRLFNGESDFVISHPKADWLLTVERLSRILCWVEHDVLNEELTWYVYRGQGGEETALGSLSEGITWNYRWGTWSEITHRPFTCGVTQSTGNRQRLLTGTNQAISGTGSAVGKVYLNKSGNNYAGSTNNIDAEYWTKPLVGVDENGGGLIGKTKRWRRLRLVTEALAAAQDLTIEWFSGYANSRATAIGSATVDMDTSARTSVGLAATAGEENKVDLKSSDGSYLHSTAMRLKLSDDADDAAWGVEGFAIEYQVLPGEKRGR